LSIGFINLDVSTIKDQSERNELRYEAVYNNLMTLIDDKIDRVVIENVFHGVNVNTTILLSRIGAIAWVICKIKKVKTTIWRTASQARKALGINQKCPKGKSKETIVQRVNELLNTKEELDKLRNDYITTVKELKDNPKLSKILDKIDKLNVKILKFKGKQKKAAMAEKDELYSQLYAQMDNPETYLHYSKNVKYKEVKERVKKIISEWNIIDQNRLKARQNRILDIYYGILTNPQHYLESIATSNFGEISKANRQISKK
jgi:Holliday junction resolvasome RuvABC endonuclease subunit